MNVLGIIAEYNPFHNGHLYHLNESKKTTEADVVVVVMSGNFTQRGQMAILDKWTRSKAAVECGVDLVLELPLVYACNSAEYFARGGIGILNGLGCVTHLSFGSEDGKVDLLKQTIQYIGDHTNEFYDSFKSYMNQGLSYAKARQEAIRQCLGDEPANAIATPNNILALEYLQQLYLLESTITPVAIKREGAGHTDCKPSGTFASATAIRNHMSAEERKNYVPPQIAHLMKQFASDEKLFDLVCSEILRQPAEELARIPAISEGLENKLKKEIRMVETLDQLIEATQSKRYPSTRISRALCQLLVGVREFHDDNYGRVLAFNEKGAELLKTIKKQETASIPIITNINKQENLPELLKYDIQASDLFNLITGRDLYIYSDFVMKPYAKSSR